MVIYKISFPNGKIYIGQTVKSLQIRMSQHFSLARRGGNNPLSNAIRKYGENNISWCEIDNAITLQELNKKEEFWIKFYNSICSTNGGNGYNANYGGNNKKWSIESRLKLSKSKKGKCVHSLEFLKKMRSKRTKLTHTIETKLKLRNINLGKKQTYGTKLKKAKIRPFYIIDYKTNEKIAICNYVNEAAIYLNAVAYRISICLNNEFYFNKRSKKYYKINHVKNCRFEYVN